MIQPLALLLTLALVAPAAAAANPLDRSFGRSHGLTHLSFDSTYSSGQSVSARRDGRLVVSGVTHGPEGRRVGVALLSRRGRPRLATTVGGFGRDFFPSGSTLLRDGSLMLTGIIGNFGSTHLTHVVLVRLTPDLQPDPAFGDGGRVVSPWGTQAHIAGAAVGADGSVVFAGVECPEGRCTPLVRRFTPDGLPDRSFGVDGAFRDPALPRPTGVWVDAHRRIVITGNDPTAHDRHTLTRLLPHGLRDEAFGSHGVASSGDASRGAYGHATDLVLLPRDAGYLVSQPVSPQGVDVVRFDRVGKPRRFARLVVRQPVRGMFIPFPWLARAADGRIAAGWVDDAGNNFLARFRPSGRADRSFGARGYRRVRRGAMGIFAATFQGRRIVGVGENPTADPRDHRPRKMVVARFRP